LKVFSTSKKCAIKKGKKIKDKEGRRRMLLSQTENLTTLVCIELRAVQPNQPGVHHCSTSGDTIHMLL
jgi:hypothetical protein